MAKARALDRRRKSIRNIRKITRTMELIATARFKGAMDRAAAAAAYTRRITTLVSHLAHSGLEVSHPLLEPRPEVHRAVVLVLTANRGLCGGYNGGVMRLALSRLQALRSEVPEIELDVSGKRGISGFRFRGIATAERYTQFEDRPRFEQVEPLAQRYLEAFLTGRLDRLDVVYTRFESLSRQYPVAETLLPLVDLGSGAVSPGGHAGSVSPGGHAGSVSPGGHAGSVSPGGHAGQEVQEEPSEEPLYEFLPSAASILEEVVPASFKIRLFKCFLDAGVTEQIARMLAMKAATENADAIISNLSMTYNRARQSQITSEILEVIGGAEAVGK
jgi:F-type H+-transporting ATPase subunit gamma